MSNGVTPDGAYYHLHAGEPRFLNQRYKSIRATNGTFAYFQEGNDEEDANVGTVEADHFAKLHPGRPVLIVGLSPGTVTVEREDA